MYIVHYSKREDSPVGLTHVLNEIIDEFESFPPRITNLLTYNRTRDELTEILIKFLVSLDAYAPAEFAAEVRRLKIRPIEETTIGQLEEGGEPLSQDDRYMAARFVQTLCKERPEYVTDLSWIASVGLLTQVVEDFVKPIQSENSTDLTIILDAPIALDYLGCSGNSYKDDASSILDSLKGIGCRLVALPITCDEMRRNLRSMLSINPSERYGYTHNAIVRREVLIEYVQAVANNPEQALTKAGVVARQRPEPESCTRGGHRCVWDLSPACERF